MKITPREVTHVADLARLELEPEAVARFAAQIDTILEYVAKLNEVDTTGVEPTAHAILLSNAFRDDEPAPSLAHARVLANAPAEEDAQFTVPKVVG